MISQVQRRLLRGLLLVVLLTSCSGQTRSVPPPTLTGPARYVGVYSLVDAAGTRHEFIRITEENGQLYGEGKSNGTWGTKRLLTPTSADDNRKYFGTQWQDIVITGMRNDGFGFFHINLTPGLQIMGVPIGSEYVVLSILGVTPVYKE